MKQPDMAESDIKHFLNSRLILEEAIKALRRRAVPRKWQCGDVISWGNHTAA
jgi:hypothetical protein